jgi:hypothetical protein
MAVPVQKAAELPIHPDALRSVVRREDITHPDLVGLYDYWRGKAGDRPVPDRADIDPIEMVAWLPHLLMTDVLPEQNDVRFRLIGTWVVDRVGGDDTGKTIADLGVTAGRAEIRETYLLAARTAQPYRRTGKFLNQSRVQDHLWAERLILPLTRGGDRVEMILAGIYFLEP